jgi:HEAT repeat protein
MARDELLALTADVARLLAAGAPAAGSSEALRKRGTVLRELSQQVAALKPVADAITRVTEGPDPERGNWFLDLLVVSRQLRSSLTTAGVEGELRPVPPGGPWQTPHAIRDLRPLLEALTRTGKGRDEKVRAGVEQGLTNDLRLLPALLGALEDNYPAVCDLVADKGLPALGRAVVPELRARLNLRMGNAGDARRLALICKLDPDRGAAVCLEAFQKGNPALRVQALLCLPDVGATEDVDRIGLELSRDRSHQVRAAGVAILRKAGSDAALERLLEAAGDKDESVRYAAMQSLSALPHPQTTPCLLERLRTDLDILAGKTPPEESKGPNNKGPKKAASEAGEIIGQRQRARGLACTWVYVLGERKDEHRLEAARVILALCEHGDPVVRRHAVQALGGLGPVTPEVVPSLIKAIDEGNPGTTTDGLQALRRIPPEARGPAIPAVLAVAGDRHRDALTRCEALAILAPHAGQHGQRILEVLRSIWQEGNRGVIFKVCEVIAAIGPPAREMLPDLLDDLRRGNPDRLVKLDLFAALDPDGELVLPVVLELLPDSPARGTTWLLLQVLQGYGPRARRALPTLYKLLEQKEINVRPWVEQTLAALEGAAQS